MKAFATPPCLSLEASTDCQDFVTSIVNNSDCIPRASLVNLRTLNRLLLQIHEKLEDRGLHLESLSSAQAYYSDLKNADGDLLLQQEELEKFEEQARTAEDGKNNYALHVPGRVICMWNCRRGEDGTAVDARCENGGMTTLRHLDITSTMMTDHTKESYKAALADLIAEVKAN